jgi:hypothetical protein
LYEVFYHQAFALLALACLPKSPQSALLTEEEQPYLATYRQALAVNSAAGVLKAQIHEVERLQQLLRRVHLNTPAALAAIQSVLAVLQASAAPE